MGWESWNPGVEQGGIATPGTNWGAVAGGAASAAGGIGGIMSALRGDRPGENVNQQAASASSDYNRQMASQYSTNPNQFFANFIRGARSADGYEQLKNFKGETELQTTPGLSSLVDMMRNPSTYGLQLDENGKATGWKPADFTPTTMDKDGHIVNGGQATYGTGGPTQYDQGGIEADANVGGGAGRGILAGIQQYGPMAGPWGMAASGVASIISALTAPSEEEIAAGKSVAMSAGDSTAYNADMAAQFSMNPNALFANAARGMRSAAGYEGLTNFQGETELQTSPEISAVIDMMRNPETYGFMLGEDGNVGGWRPQEFTPTTLDEEGKLVDQNQQTYGGSRGRLTRPRPNSLEQFRDPSDYLRDNNIG